MKSSSSAQLNDRCGLLTPSRTTRCGRGSRNWVVNASKLSRQLSELRDERDELKGMLRELENSFDHETAAHAKLKAAHFEAIEAQRLSEANLQEKLSATTTRLEAAEQLLVEARAGMHEQDATIRESEQRVLEKSLEVKSLEVQVADLEKDLASARAGHMEGQSRADCRRGAFDDASQISARERGCSLSAYGTEGRDGRSF